MIETICRVNHSKITWDCKLISCPLPMIDKLMKAQSERERLGSLIRMVKTNKFPIIVNAPNNNPGENRINIIGIELIFLDFFRKNE